MFVRSSQFGKRTLSIFRAHTASKSCHVQWAVASSTLAGLSLYVLSQNPVYNDALSEKGAPTSKQQLQNVDLSPLVWGSNLNHLIAPDRDSNDCIKSPTHAPMLFSNPLRDLAFSNGHAACVDAGGNVYQWGDTFFGSETSNHRQPQLTLQGKNIISVAVTPSRIFALSASGKIYALSSSLSRQTVPSSQHSIWSLFGSKTSDPLHTVLNTDVALLWGERFTSISTGSDHLLALTSRGRTFAHPVTRLANWHGQLGVRKITVPDPTDPTKRLTHELSPQITRDSLRNETTPPPDAYCSDIEPSDAVDDRKLEFCDRLFEIPVLRGLDVQQAVAGDRTSFVVTRLDNRVLGWGANEFGQLGLGVNVTLPMVAVPTEVVLSKFTERGTISRCVNIAAGGDLAFFTVERELPREGAHVIDVLACGNGQWGGLGNASYSNAQGAPVKVKGISNVLEYDEKTNSLKPLRLHHISVAPGPGIDSTRRNFSSGHAIATLDTLPLSYSPLNSNVAIEVADSPGRDVTTWGLNQHYQLGNGKRSSASAPISVQTGDGGGRLMCKVGKEKVRDFNGSVVGGKMEIEQRAIAGPGLSVVYWRVV